MADPRKAVDSFEHLIDIFYLPAEYPGQQRFFCYLHQEEHAERLVQALAHRLQGQVPSAQMGVHALCGVDWSSREAVVWSLAEAMTQAAPALAARAPVPLSKGNHRAEHRLHILMDPPDDALGSVLTFVLAVPGAALRDEMVDCLFQLRALMAGSDHNWIIVAPLAIARFGEGVETASSFASLFEPYEVDFDPGELPDEVC